MGLPLQQEKENLKRKLLYFPHDLDEMRCGKSRPFASNLDFSRCSKSRVFHRFLSIAKCNTTNKNLLTLKLVLSVHTIYNKNIKNH